MARAVAGAAAWSPPDRNVMSVINRMLQDIDRRQAEADLGASAAHPDIRRVTRRAIPSLSSSGLVWNIVLLAAGGVLLVWAWYQWRAPSPTLTSALPPVSQTALPPSATLAQAVLPVLPVPPVPTAAAAVSAAGLLPAAPEKPPREAAVAPAKLATTPSEKLKMSMQLSLLVAETPPVRPAIRSMAAAPAAAASLPGTTTMTNVPVRQVAADETIAAARALWADGARADAVATLREALVAAESARNQRATAPLAREFARLEVADNRPQNALDLLRRLENMFGEDAEAWALRGNAEQRLALHAEATQSYLAALRLRPSEGKWMLGAAISLAAAGQPDEARVWVERARERDAVTPAIASYLQQLGISSRR